MTSVISWSASSCQGCIKCLKACPVEAISIVNRKVQIDEDKCIHCDTCMRTCPSHVLRVNGCHISDTLGEHEYNVVLIPTSILSEMKSFTEFQQVCLAIKKLGFDEVAEYSDIEGYLYHQALVDSSKQEGTWLTSFCPTINQLIEKHYPTLFEQMLPYEYPVEVAAKLIRKRYVDKSVGIYSLCECVGKMLLAKKPFGNTESNIDYALSISHIFPKINHLKNEDTLDIDINKYGVKSVVSQTYSDHHKSLVKIDGLNQAKHFLNLLEFDNLENVDLGALYACYEGCIGGYYLWSNPYDGGYHLKNMMDNYQQDIAHLNKEDYLLDRELDLKDQKSMKERIAWAKRINAILDTLPQFDCGACGFANCRSLAENVEKGLVSVDTCRVRKGGQS